VSGIVPDLLLSFNISRKEIIQVKTFIPALGFLVVLAMTSGCGQRYDTQGVSETERTAIEKAVQAYVYDTARRVDTAASRARAWPGDIKEAEVLSVERMSKRYKALVRLKGKTTRSCYFLLERQAGEYRVTGIVGS